MARAPTGPHRPISLDDEGNGNGRHTSGRVTPVDAMPPFDPSDPESLGRAITYTADALVKVSEDAKVTCSLATQAHRFAQDGAHDMRALRETVVRMESKLDGHSVMIERIEGVLLVELARIGTAFGALDTRVRKAEEVATKALDAADDADVWAAKSGEHHQIVLTEAQMRASKSEAFIEEVARRAVAAEDERRKLEASRIEEGIKAERDARKARTTFWSAFGGMVVAVGTAAGLAFANSCGG